MRHPGPLRHGPCKRTRKPRAVATASRTEPRRRANTRATAQCLRSALLLLPRRRCATAPASDKPRSPACGLQAATSSGAEPRRHAVKLRHGFVSPAIAVPSAPTFHLGWLGCVLPAACAVGGEAAHGLSGYVRNIQVSSLRSTALSRAGVNRKRFNITAHYPK